MTALTVDLQHLGCRVKVGQRHMLHAAGVGDPILPFVHLELETTPHCEGFSCGIQLLTACRESENEHVWITNFIQFHQYKTISFFRKTVKN